MIHVHTCPECGGVLSEVLTCQDYFHQMLFWEAEHPVYGAEVHHLMVLCFHLQHPSLYSPEGLDYARHLLVEFLNLAATPEQVRRRNRFSVDSSRRKWKIKGAGGAHGAYKHAICWAITAADVVAEGVDSYCDNVRLWVES